jgi:hypothetical protein
VNDRLVAAFKTLEKAYKSRKRRGKTTIEDKIEFQKAANAEEERQTQRQNRQAYVYDEQLQHHNLMFIPEPPHAMWSNSYEFSEQQMETEHDMPLDGYQQQNQNQFDVVSSEEEPALLARMSQRKTTNKRGGRRGTGLQTPKYPETLSGSPHMGVFSDSRSREGLCMSTCLVRY